MLGEGTTRAAVTSGRRLSVLQLHPKDGIQIHTKTPKSRCASRGSGLYLQSLAISTIHQRRAAQPLQMQTTTFGELADSFVLLIRLSIGHISP